MNERILFANGKLLLTGEYAVLDGAKALALPTTYGQYFQVEKLKNPSLFWEAYDENGKIWFEAKFKLPNLDIISTSDIEGAMFIRELFQAASQQKELILNYGPYIKTSLTFSKNWGLGSSSTLLWSFAKWLELDPYLLLEKTMGGSGYDIACADSKRPIIYQLEVENRVVEPVLFNPPFRDQLYFLHLNQKQNSRKGIKTYRDNLQEKNEFVKQINSITEEVLVCNKLSDFNALINLHEDIVSYFLQLSKVKNEYFSDFEGSIKSLGAWGGDFCLVTSEDPYEAVKNYFSRKGFDVLIPYKSIIL